MVFSRFLRSPRTVGALSASSQALARAIVDAIDLDGPVRVVELGPGTGALTGPILERLGPDGRLLAIDIEPEFVKQVSRRWPQVECVCASAEELEHLVSDRDLSPVDHIISGLPFASLPVEMTNRILAAIEASLRSGGTFTTFQYVYAYALPAAIAFRRGMSGRMGARPSRRLVVRNLPPAWVLTWTKP
jgi:phospholipid N-methyltransferase